MTLGLRILIAVLSLLISASAFAEQWDLTPEIKWGSAPAKINDPLQVQFNNIPGSTLQQGYTSENQWFKITLHNDSAQPMEKVLYFDSPLIGRLLLWRDNAYAPSYSGPGFTLVERSYHSRLAAFPISLEPYQSAEFIIKREIHHALNSKVFLADVKDFESQEDSARMVFFFYIGGILALVAYNFLLGVYTNERDYLIYAFFAACFGVTALILHGVIDTYIFLNRHLVFSNYLMFFSSLSAFAACMFVKRFLNITRDIAVCYWGIRIGQCLSLIPMMASFFANTHRGLFWLGFWIDGTIALSILFFIFCGFYMYFKHSHRLAVYFLFSWAVVFVGTFVWLAAFHGFIPNTSVTMYSLLFANLGEMIILSLGLAYKIRILDEQKRRALRAAEDKERYHRLVRVLSHDVANTASGLLYHSEMLKKHVQNEGAGEHLERIHGATDQLIQILKSVRHEEVYHVFKEHAEMETLELLPVCEEVVRQYAWQLKEKNLQVTLNVPANISVRADRSALLNQVLSNLFSNAIKFSNDNKLITVNVFEASDTVVCEIADQGVGISADDLGRIFSQKRLVTSRGTLNETGTGLGTTLIAEYMRLFGGKVEISSVHHSQNTDSGTKVRLIFPTKA
ncbi:7TM diverse intracellular signaling domain-containing protein [Bdellovibrio sp. HCB274]|uniref:sensor histidine kinase n=1 Tax=Bdellovibrio sp. HCB274 TaxID=3394361 RepID=UPI0039B36AF4